MIPQLTQPAQVSEITALRNELQKKEQFVAVLENCRAADSLTLQSFQKRNVQLMREIATRDARILELEREVRDKGACYLNPSEAA